MALSYENIQLALGQKWLNQYCSDIPNYLPVPESGAYDTVGPTIIGVLSALQKNVGVSLSAISDEYLNVSHLFGDDTKAKFGDYSLSASSDFSNEYNLNMLKILQIGLWCKGKNPGDFGVATNQLTTAINELMAEAGILPSQQDGIASRMIFIAISTEVDFTIPEYSNGSPRTRKIQQTINGAYGKERGFLVPCDGIKAVSTIAGFLYYYQRTIGLTVEQAQNAYGLYNTETYDLSPILEEGSTNSLMVTILQDALYLINGYDSPSNGIFDSATEEIVEQLQLSVALPVTGIVDKLTWGYVLESCGYQNVAPTVCDTSMSLAPSDIQILKNNNITMVGRYLTGKFAMTQEEIKNLTESNIAVIPIFEYGNQLDYFTFEQGENDAIVAVLAAEKLGIPADNSVTIYFAVDNDFTLGDLTSNISDYFRGVSTRITEARLGYNIGIYGARYACTYMLEQGYVTNSYVASSSYEFQLNMGYPMPASWGFNQYSTMNINANGVPSEILLGGCIPIDKVVSSGYDKGVTKVTQNGVTTSINSKDIAHPQNLAEVNEKYKDVLETIANELFTNVFNIKSTSLMDYISKGPVGTFKKNLNAPWFYLPPNEVAYIRGDFGLKYQGGSGSIGTLYYNKDQNKTFDYMPFGFMGGNLGSTINTAIIDQGDLKKTFASLLPTYSKTIAEYGNDPDIVMGLQFYSNWSSQTQAKPGYWELGVEIGFNVSGGDGKLMDVPASMYFFIDIIIGVKDAWIMKLLGKAEEKAESTFNSIMKFINKTIDTIKEDAAGIIEEGGEDVLEFSDETPEIFESLNELENAENEEVIINAWEDFVACFDSPAGEQVLAALILMLCF